MKPLLRLPLLLFVPLLLAAQEIGTVTLAEGNLRVIRGAEVLRGTEGMRLHEGDILETSASGFAQLELTGGTIVALGGDTRLFALRTPRDRTHEKTAEFILLSGWLKSEGEPNSAAYEYETPLLAGSAKGGTLLLHAAAKTAEVYVESGSAAVGEVSAEGTVLHPATANSGQFFARRAGQKPTASSRPDTTFVDAMPRQFRDTLPSRQARFSGKPASTPKPDHEVTYSEIHPWLTMSPSWRRSFVERFRPRLKDPEFRKSVEAHLQEHPEWGPFVHPEKIHSDTQPDHKAGASPGGESR